MNKSFLKSGIIKNILIGLLPLIVFTIAEEILLHWTNRTNALTGALGLALLVGFIAFGISWIHNKKPDWFIGLDTLLLMGLGGISILLDNAVFFKLKPALIELILVVLVGITAFSNHPLLINMMKRMMGEMTIKEFQFNQLKQIMRLLFYILSFHVFLIVYAAFFLSQTLWAFISGALFYGMVGLVPVSHVGWKWFRFFIYRRKYRHDEWFDLVDTSGNIIGKSPRSICHGNPQLLHRTVHLHVINKRGELYLQKRSKLKDVQPGKWDTAVGGHVQSGEKLSDAIGREIQEELGCVRLPHEFIFSSILTNDHESELISTYRGYSEGPFSHPPEEIEEGKFWKINDIILNIGKNIFTPNFEVEFNLLQKKSVIGGHAKRILNAKYQY